MTAQPRVLMALILVLLIPASVFAQSTVNTRATTPVSVIACRYCDGDPLTQARLFGGGTTDATIEFHIENGSGQPLPGIPAEDIWVASPDLLFCSGAHIADFPTDSSGNTEISGPLCAGGCMEIPSLQGFVSGMLITPTSDPIPYIKVNGPDINGDLIHSLTDIALFAQGYFATPIDYCSDLDWDGFPTAIDVMLFATHFFHGPCP